MTRASYNVFLFLITRLASIELKKKKLKYINNHYDLSSQILFVEKLFATEIYEESTENDVYHLKKKLTEL